MQTWTITAYRHQHDRIATAIEAVNKRARRLGMAPISFEVGGTVRVEYQIFPDGFAEYRWVEQVRPFDRPTGRVRDLVEFIAKGEIPAFRGWVPVAVVDRLMDGTSVVVRNIPNAAGQVESPPEEFCRVTRCDHCEVSRQRNSCVVFKKGEEFKTVGTRCLINFCPEATNPERLMDMARMVFDIASRDWEEEGRGERTGRALWSIMGLLEVAAAVVRVEGGYKKRQEDRPLCSTRDTVQSLLSPPRSFVTDDERRKWEEFRDRYAVAEADKLTASAAHEYCRTIEGDGEYFRNLRALMPQVGCDDKHFGLVVSGIAAYGRHLAAAANAASPDTSTPMGRFIARKAAGTLATFGEVGKRMPISLTVTGTFQHEGEWGPSTIVRFLDDEGNQAVWFASGIRDFEKGAVLTGKATVKKHTTDNRNHQPATVLTRVST